MSVIKLFSALISNFSNEQCCMIVPNTATAILLIGFNLASKSWPQSCFDSKSSYITLEITQQDTWIPNQSQQSCLVIMLKISRVKDMLIQRVTDWYLELQESVLTNMFIMAVSLTTSQLLSNRHTWIVRKFNIIIDIGHANLFTSISQPLISFLSLVAPHLCAYNEPITSYLDKLPSTDMKLLPNSLPLNS